LCRHAIDAERRIKELEARLGVTLFERGHRHVMLTPLGKETATRAQRLLVDAEELVGWARNAQEALSGPLRFGVIPTVGPYVLPSLLSHLGTALPKAQAVRARGSDSSPAGQAR